jgi:hypothetical protein
VLRIVLIGIAEYTRGVNMYFGYSSTGSGGDR